jgi:hypothetical protein
MSSRRLLSLFWAPADLNPEGEPSWDKEVRPPAEAGPEAAKLTRPERAPSQLGTPGPFGPVVRGLEVFAGGGGLTRALGEAGLGMMRSWDAFPEKASLSRSTTSETSLSSNVYTGSSAIEPLSTYMSGFRATRGPNSSS